MAMTMIKAACEVLSEHKQPMHVAALWSEIAKRGLVETTGKTPEQTLAAMLMRRSLGLLMSRPSSERIFYRDGANTFGLAEWLPQDKRAELTAQELEAAGTDGAGSYDIEAFLASVEPQRLPVRRDAAAEARGLIEQRLGALGEGELRELFILLNTDFDGGKMRRDRFGLAFTGDLANKIVGQLDEANQAIRRLWEAEGDDAVYAALDAFYAANILGAGRSLPTAILHVKAPELYFPLMKRLAAGYMALTDQPAPRGLSSAKYREYVEALRALANEYEIPGELVDAVLAHAGRPRPPQLKGEATAERAYEFAGFERDAFNFLSELAANNREDWFQENKARFRKALDAPLRALVRDLGAHVVGPISPEIETTANNHRTIAKIRKNIWGKQAENCYHEHYWAAFYRTGRSRASDAQLYVNVFSDRLECGFYIGTRAEEVRAKFLEAVESNAELVAELLSDVTSAPDISVMATKQDDPRATMGERLEPASAVALISAYERDARICRTFAPDDPIVGSQQLVTAIGDVFRIVYPFFLLATNDAPREAIEAFRAGRTSSVESGASPEDDEYSIDDLLGETLLDRDEILDLEALLDDKRQIVLCGPPGTGKTFIGERLGRYLAGANGEVKVVQFHPSYSYEDFVEGIRPGVGSSGGLVFDVHDGIFKRFCDEARQQPADRFVLVVDEINRGNLPRIFGELLYLLENRGSKVELPYSKKPFSVPENVLLIGTMNSADHSIALVDFALRRRFHFVYYAPRPDILRRWLRANRPEMEHVAHALERLNERLVEAGIEPDLLVGHSHFMRPRLDEDRLRLVWDHTVHPLLTEYFYGRAHMLESYTFDTFFELEVESGPQDDSTQGEHDADNQP